MIVGTAGHIDHGKTALVKALTGVDTDRLPEEKARGITIDIGFAHCDLDSIEVSFIDVPGHEKFVRNMLAGVGGIDLVYEQGAGFISHTHHLVVGPACAGVNFLIICFLCLYFSFERHFPDKTEWLFYSLLTSAGATVAANGLRIFVSAHLWNANFYSQWITRDEMHRLAGTVIYFASLLGLYFAVEARLGTRAPTTAPLFCNMP